MKRTLLTLAFLAGAVLLAAPAVQADPDWGFGIAIDIGGGNVHGFFGHRPYHRHQRVIVAPRPVVHVHQRIAVVQKIWVPARYERVFVGYSFCGFPVYRTVCVSPGHHQDVIVGYRCAGCGCPL